MWFFVSYRLSASRLAADRHHDDNSNAATAGICERNLADGEFACVEDLGVAGSQGEGRIRRAIDPASDRSRAIVDDLSEDGIAASVAQDVGEVASSCVGRSIRKRQAVSLEEGLLDFVVAVNAAVVGDNLDERLVEGDLRVGESLPVVAIGEGITVVQEAVDSVGSHDVNRPLDARGNRLTRGHVDVQAALLGVGELYAEYAHLLFPLNKVTVLVVCRYVSSRHQIFSTPYPGNIFSKNFVSLPVVTSFASIPENAAS